MKKVMVGMSGGVDSSVAALLLRNQGYDVMGVTLKLFSDEDIIQAENAQKTCCALSDVEDARSVAYKLGFEHLVFNFKDNFKEYVMNQFAESYLCGATPNPCIECNRHIKFDKMLRRAMELEYDYIATGHYARLEHGRLLRGVDNNKDQTYFLSQVKPSEFKDVLFPVGGLTKPEVRKIALNANLPVAEKKDSTGICFIGERHYQEFVNNYIKGKEGDIVDIDTMKVIGKHHGLMNYTIGQRRNVGLSGDQKRHYVCGKDTEKNILYVAFGDDNKYLMSNEAVIESMNYISDLKPTFATCKFRYRGEDVPITIEYISDNEIIVKYESAKAVTPGQACVIYLGSEVIGGGIIKEVRKDNTKLWYL